MVHEKYFLLLQPLRPVLLNHNLKLARLLLLLCPLLQQRLQQPLITPRLHLHARVLLWQTMQNLQHFEPQ
jgi:hypothetical protein